ncbi:sacsin N-terminal ATP-binding-like domain-containing protein [Kribbella deserti]|uniref:Sacsin N-terminal ATP-binding-like domain-containing protein n=1 Tax=Kribbella deserti TaxID=1926257 RepID=A0ABV6R078_9ACTN
MGEAGIRERVLAGWTSSAMRFREDANAEEDLALGGYIDRVVIELAQNAADAAARAGVPGRIRFTLRDGILVAANTGAPLTAAGVESLATLRASAKRDDTDAVGRFGVGFAAVLGVSDEPAVLSRTGGVRFSQADSAALVAEVAADSPALEAELRRRDGHVPVLRLPFAAEGEPPAGYDTAVVLPLRDESADQLVRRLLADADDALLLALPGLERIEIDVDGEERVLTDVASRWYVHRTGGVFDQTLYADRPTEERARPYWSVVWALPLTDHPVPPVVHAPTPTDEPLSLPALLLASFPLDPARRHVAMGALTDRLIAEAAASYAELVRLRAEADPAGDVHRLVPTGLAAGPLDRMLREAVLELLPDTPMLRAVEDNALIRPRDAVVVTRADDSFNTVLAPLVSGLVRSAPEPLGVRRLDLADLVDQLGSVAANRPPKWWRELYAAMSAMVLEPLTREALGALPVPLADDRLVRGARGLLLPGEGLVAEALSIFGEYGVRVVHPDAVHPSLERLGALPAGPREILADPGVRTAVEHSAEADDADAIAAAVLTILAAADPGRSPWWLSDLALRDDEGELVPANALVIPGSDAEAVLDDEEVAPVSRELLDRFGSEVLEAAGVLRTLRVASASDVLFDALPEELTDLDLLADWAEEMARATVGSPYGVTAGEVAAIRDLDWIVDDAWPRVLAVIGSDPALRPALVTPARVVGPDDRAFDVPSYTAWWIRGQVDLEDGPLTGRADPEADPALATLLDPSPEWAVGLDAEVRTAIGLVRTVADLDAAGVGVVLNRLVDPDRVVDETTMLRLWAQLGAVTAYPSELPDRVRVLGGDGTTRTVAAGNAVVVDAPMWLQRTDLGGFLVATGPAADGLSDLLDIPMAQDAAAGIVSGKGVPAEVPAELRRLIPELPATWWEHEELLVDGVEVSWWVDASGAPHAATTDGLANALAWSANHWSHRHVISLALTDPTTLPSLTITTTFD